MEYVHSEPTEYAFKDVNGHDGKIFDTASSQTKHLIIECQNRLTVSLIQHESEFNYYVLEGEGYFVVNGERQAVEKGNLVVIPPGIEYTFSGQLRMLLINTPPWTPEQETIIVEDS